MVTVERVCMMTVGGIDRINMACMYRIDVIPPEQQNKKHESCGSYYRFWFLVMMF